jgi:hypothetical protein
MRTTLDIAEDVLQAAKELARRSGKTAGQVLSELAREALSQSGGRGVPSKRRAAASFLGFEPFPRRGGLVTDELVSRLREDDAV